MAAAGWQPSIYLTRPRLPAPVTSAPEFPVYGPRLLRAGRFLVAAEPRAAAASLLGGRRLRPAPAAVLGASITETQARWLAARIGAGPPDAILIDTIFRAALLDQPSLAGLPSILVAHDLFHRRHAALRLAGYHVVPAMLDAGMEAALLGRADAILAIQEEEADEIRRLCPDRAVIAAPMPAQPMPRPPGVDRDPTRLIFLGSAALPNLDGLRWFLADIWPRLRAVRADIRIDLAGDCGTALGRLPGGVRRLGRCADLAPALHRAALAIAPLRAGSGLKIKLLDYARHGLWTVGTPGALAGMIADPLAPLVEAETPADFVDSVLEGLAGPPAEEAALAYVRAHYAPAKVFAPLLEMLDAIAGAP